MTRALVILLALTSAALADDHQHPPQDADLHDAFYSTWRVPNGGAYRGSSCCNKKDCYPAQIKSQAGQVFFLHRETRQWKIIPQGIIEANQPDPRESPDGQSHVCASPTGAVYCAVLGGGI